MKERKEKKEKKDELMNLAQFTAWCKKSPQRHLHIIAEYAEAKEPEFTLKTQWEMFIKRNLRAARMLVPFTEDQIDKASKELYSYQDKWLHRWTLETLVKILIP